MDAIQVVILALIQGVTEFLPISSSAHLILPAQILGWVDQGLAFDVAVHSGTLAAVVLYFRNDLRLLLVAFLESLFRRNHTEESRLAWGVVIATIPAGIAGFLLDQYAENLFRSTLVIALATLFFAILLYVADRYGPRRMTEYELTVKQALWVGLAQMLALIPGTSRSGITMTAGLALGLTPTSAARFSFLLSIPLIAAAGSLKIWDLLAEPGTVDWSILISGSLVAFVSAVACIKLFLTALERIGMMPFIIYRLLLGIVLLIFFI